MKSSVFAILLLVAGAFALPQVDNSARSNLVEQRVKDGVRRLSALIRLLGLDPLEREYEEEVFAPIPGIFEVKAYVKDLRFTGASDIVTNFVEYNILAQRLRFEFQLPELHVVIGDAGVEIILLENVDTISLNGSLAVRGVTLAGEISFNTSWEDGITVRSITLDLSFGRTEADLKLVAFEKDYSEFLNTLLGKRIPALLESSRNEINRFLEFIVRIILNIVL